ncbi:hypothetical protein ACRYGW_13200 [Mycobacteroides abscessus]
MTTTFNAVRRIWTRHRLTPQERANLQLAYSPLAVVSASLGHIHRGSSAVRQSLPRTVDSQCVDIRNSFEANTLRPPTRAGEAYWCKR